MKDRIRKLRKTLDLTQRQFAERIGMKSNTIATYEMGRAFPSDPTINNICKEFNVREEWLRTGEGDMFAPAPSTALDALARERGLSHGAYIAIEKFLNLKPEIQEGIIQYFTDVATALNVGAGAASAMDEASEEALHAELERQITAEKVAEEKSGAL